MWRQIDSDPVGGARAGMTLRCFSEKELAGCGGITLPFRDWPEGTQLDHPKYGRGQLWSRDDDGRMIFEFPDSMMHPDEEDAYWDMLHAAYIAGWDDAEEHHEVHGPSDRVDELTWDREEATKLNGFRKWFTEFKNRISELRNSG